MIDQLFQDLVEAERVLSEQRSDPRYQLVMDLVRQSGQYAQSERLSLLQSQLEQLGLDNAPAQQRAEEAYQALREYALAHPDEQHPNISWRTLRTYHVQDVAGFITALGKYPDPTLINALINKIILNRAVAEVLAVSSELPIAVSERLVMVLKRGE